MLSMTTWYLGQIRDKCLNSDNITTCSMEIRKNSQFTIKEEQVTACIKNAVENKALMKTSIYNEDTKFLTDQLKKSEFYNFE